MARKEETDVTASSHRGDVFSTSETGETTPRSFRLPSGSTFVYPVGVAVIFLRQRVDWIRTRFNCSVFVFHGEERKEKKETRREGGGRREGRNGVTRRENSVDSFPGCNLYVNIFYQAVTAPYFSKDNGINNKKWATWGGGGKGGGRKTRDRNGERFKWNSVFRFTGTLDLADASMAEKARTWMKRMQPVCRGCIHFARVIRPSCDVGKGPRLFCGGYCTLGTSYPSHRPSGILAQHFPTNSRGNVQFLKKFSRVVVHHLRRFVCTSNAGL